jgi:hypothetical protein
VSCHRKPSGSKTGAQARVQKLIRELRLSAPEIADLETAIERLERQDAALGIPHGVVPSSAFRQRRDLEIRLAQAREKEKEARAQAAFRLGELRHPLAAEALIAALQDPYPLVRRHAASALGAIGDPRAMEALAGLLEEEREPDRTVRDEARRALAKIRK